MKFDIDRDNLLKPLQLVSGAIERRHTLPILSNVLLDVSDNLLTLTGTDLEVELVSSTPNLVVHQAGRITIPAKKLFDICRGLSADAKLTLELIGESVQLRTGRSKYTLSSLSATDYPNLESWQSEQEIVISKLKLRELLESVQFSMANQDVRYYLNGLSLETEGQTLRAVATDGHRLALNQLTDSEAPPMGERQLIVPRKAVLEILRLVDQEDASVQILFGQNHVRVIDADFSFTTKLVDGRFPDYRRVMPRGGDKLVTANREGLKQAFSRAAILSNEKFRGVRLNLAENELKITATNPEQEEAVEVVEVDYQGADLEVGFNVSYLLDVLNAIKSENVTITLMDANSSALVEGYEDGSGSMYVVMPMRL